jgi:DNA repair protein RecN (Recombination protein N)
MLSRLSVHNYAIIDQLQIDFSPKLNIITGETGAGKSIIVGAMGLILGQRVDSSVLSNKDKKCIIEGVFNVQELNDRLKPFFEDNELDIQEELIIRREIAPTGKSRAFINDTPVTLNQLNQLSSELVDLHQQFDTLELGETEFQREVLDALAGNFTLVKEYNLVYQQVQLVKKSLEELKNQKIQFEKEMDYNQFQFNELEEAGFKESELENLEQELNLLSNSEAIKTALQKVYYELKEDDKAINTKIKSLVNQINNWATVNPELSSLAERLQSAFVELQDIAEEAESINNGFSYDLATIEKINDRLSLGYRLFKKHGVKTTDELLTIKNDLQTKLQAILQIDDEIAILNKRLIDNTETAEELANKISAARKVQIKPLEEQVNKLLAQVGMPNARLRVQVEKLTSLQQNGIDAIQFLFNANLPAGDAGKSTNFQPIRKVASGGELSRLMLCLKSLVAKSMNLPTLIFDEIDTGISGEAAKQIGIIMKELSAARQIISITHQPQIAGRADAHFMVFKAVKDERITTAVTRLNKKEQIIAIAKMLSGEKPTAAALKNAKEMVMS